MFDWGRFTSHSGLSLDYKINCWTLTDKDLSCLAQVVAEKVKYGKVIGIPSGGLRFAHALSEYIIKDNNNVLVVDDVLTTGASIVEEMNKYSNVTGIVIFSRTNKHIRNVIPIFKLHPVFTT